MEYGLYKENIISLPEFNKRYMKQIYSKKVRMKLVIHQIYRKNRSINGYSY